MAIKDWNSLKNPTMFQGNPLYRFRKKGDKELDLIIYREYDDYIVQVAGILIKHFDSKSEALKFAKAYMRSH